MITSQSLKGVLVIRLSGRVAPQKPFLTFSELHFGSNTPSLSHVYVFQTIGTDACCVSRRSRSPAARWAKARTFMGLSDCSCCLSSSSANWTAAFARNFSSAAAGQVAGRILNSIVNGFITPRILQCGMSFVPPLFVVAACARY